MLDKLYKGDDGHFIGEEVFFWGVHMVGERM
jgi:hypothetical protein